MTSRVGPLFLKTTRGNIVFAWMGILGNAALVSRALHSLVTDHVRVSVSWYHVVLTLLAGLFLLDLLSGLVHWFSDTWLDERTPGFERTFSVSREHHVYPQNITGYAARDLVAYSCWPSLVLLGPPTLTFASWTPTTLTTYLGAMLCTTVSFGMFFGSHCHLLAHRRTDSRILRFLRSARFLVTPAYHRVHHSGRHDVRYAVVNGWSNPVCDHLGLWRGLEALIQATTGATPRRSDDEWSKRFQKNPA